MTLADAFIKGFEFLLAILPIIIPIFLGILLFNLWVNFARKRFLSEQEYKILRITPPRDVFKTPAAMELFLNSLYQTVGEANPIQKYWEGRVRPWFSLEIASNQGDVGFYIWTRKSFVGFLQTQIYAQYPGIEIQEVEDYTDSANYFSGKYKLWACELELTEPDPVPIMTYVDYGLDKTMVEEESKVDPITPMLEYMGSLKQGEFAWMQIIVRAHKKEDKDKTKWFGMTDNWKDDAKKIIQEIREQSVVKIGKGDKESEIPLATKGQIDKITAIERSISKTPFDAGIRAIYMAEKDVFDPVNIGGLVGSFRQYSSSSLNGFKPAITTATDWWNDPFGRRLEYLKTEFYEAYKERNYFWRPLFGKTRKKFILNNEELATIFHFPGSVAGTPSLHRVQSKKAEAPSNLPV